MNAGKLSTLEKIGYGLGDFGCNIVFQTVLIFLPAFYTDIFGITPAAMGLMLLVVRLLDTVTDPAMGVLTDLTRTRWGRYRPYLLWFAIPLAAVFVLVHMTPDFGDQGNLAYAYFTYSLLMILYTIVNVPYCAIGGVITHDSGERVSANSYRFFLAPAAGVLITFCGPALVAYFGGDDQRVGFPWAMAVLGLVAVAALFCCFCLTRERVEPAQPSRGSLALDLRALLRNDQWVIVASMFFVLLIPVVLRSGTAIYYIRWYAGQFDAAVVTAFLTAGTLSQMVGSCYAPAATRWLGNVRAYIVTQVVIIVASIGLYFVGPKQLVMMFSLHLAINFFIQLGAPILFTMAADTVEYGELKTGRRVTGLVFSGSLFTLKLGVAVGGWLLGLLLSIHGYDGESCTQTPQAIHGIVLSMTLLPALGHALLIPLVSLYRLSPQRCLEIRQQLDGELPA